MTATQRFIERAIEGGWKPGQYRNRSHYRTRGRTRWNKDTISASITPHETLLDPAAWQAVGKWEEWCEDRAFNSDGTCTSCSWPHCQGGWLERWHRMIDALAEGKSVEEYLATIV